MTRKKRKIPPTKGKSFLAPEYNHEEAKAKYREWEEIQLAKRKKEATIEARKEFFEKIFAAVIMWPGFIIMTIIHKEFDHIWGYYSFRAIRQAYKKSDFWEEVQNTTILYIGAILWLIVLPILIF